MAARGWAHMSRLPPGLMVMVACGNDDCGNGDDGDIGDTDAILMIMVVLVMAVVVGCGGGCVGHDRSWRRLWW